jgi:hypothetical protein
MVRDVQVDVDGRHIQKIFRRCLHLWWGQLTRETSPREGVIEITSRGNMLSLPKGLSSMRAQKSFMNWPYWDKAKGQRSNRRYKR